VTPVKHLLPVVTREIGDTWIYGYASDPLKMMQNWCSNEEEYNLKEKKKENKKKKKRGEG
jgi:hypothetical protein